MNNNYMEVYTQLLANLKKKHCDRIFNVVNAFEFAEKLHSGQFRSSGEDYISHPVEVASILEKLNFDTDVISAALLHDVIEDCGVTASDIEKDFNKAIAEIVDAVTAINKQDYKTNPQSLFEDAEFLRPSIEGQTYKKLISIGKKNKLAFYIKFADRLHNLRTISVLPRNRQVEKVKETEKWILPLVKILKSNYFYYAIKEECFKILNKDKGEEYGENYLRYHKSNSSLYDQIQMHLSDQVNKYLIRSKMTTKVNKVIMLKEMYENVFENIKKVIDVSGLTSVKQSHFNKVPTSLIFVIFNENIPDKKATEILFSVITEASTRDFPLKIVGYEYDKDMEKGYLIVSDYCKNKYKINAMSLKDYVQFRNGMLEGTDIEFIDEDNTREIITNYITVKTRSGEPIKIAENSTVLDFAFKIHKDIGFSCKYALINGMPSKIPLYARLSDGDQVVLITEKDEKTGLKKNIAKLRWLAYVKTEYAQKVLIRHFEKQLTS